MLIYREKIINLRDNPAVDLLRRRQRRGRDYLPHPAQNPIYACDKYATSTGNWANLT